MEIDLQTLMVGSGALGAGGLATLAGRALLKLPRLMVSATKALDELVGAVRDLRAFLREGTSAARVGHQVLQHELANRGIDYPGDTRDSDSIAVVRMVSEGRIEEARRRIEQLDPEDSLPIHLDEDLRLALTLLREARAQRETDGDDAPKKRDRSWSDRIRGAG